MNTDQNKTNTDKNINQDAQQTQGTKLLMQSYLSFLRNTANKNQDEVEQKLKEVLDIFSHLSAKDLFCNNDEISESEKYFVNEFTPELLKILLSENSKSPIIRELIQDLLNIYTKEFQKSLQSLSLDNTEFKFNLWEKVVSIFNSEETLFYRTAPDNTDATECFLDSIYEKLNPNFAEWREALKPGDLVDYLYKDSAMSFSGYKGIGVCNWTRAEVLSVDANKVVQLRLLGTDDIINTSLTSYFILPFKTLSLDYEWREQIQKGDEIDFLDNRSWYRSTVLDVNENISLKSLLKKAEGEKAEPVKRKFIKYGLRIYRPEARNTDSKGNSFYGWGETYDKEISVHDPRIRKVNTFAKVIYNYEIINYYPLDSKRFTELESIVPREVGEHKFYIIPKKFDNKNISRFYYDLLHKFTIEQNGFETIIKILHLMNSVETPNNHDNDLNSTSNTKTENSINANENNPNSPNLNSNKSNNNLSVQLIEHLFPAFSVIISFFNLTNQFLHIQFASEYLKEVIQLSLSILKKFSLIETRNFKREKLENLFKQLKEIMYRVYIDSDVNSILDLFGTEFGVNCLKHSIILDKKLLGFKVLNDTLTEVAKNCSNSSSFTDRHLPAGQLVEKLMQQNIFELIFGPSSHSQILQKSGDLLKSLLMTKALKAKDLQRLLEICEDATDAETKGFILKGFIANAIQLNVDGSYFIIKYIIAKKTQYLQTGLSRFKITNDDIDLLISAFKALPLAAVKEISKRVGEFLFDIIFYEEEGIENPNAGNNLSSTNNNSNFASNNASSSNSPCYPFLDNASANSANLITSSTLSINNTTANNLNSNVVSILSGLKYEKIVEDFVVLMKAIEFRDYSNKVFEDILIILKNRKLENSEAASNKDFIGIVKILRLLMGSYLNILDDSTRSRLLILIYDDYAILDLLMSFITQYHKEVMEILEKEKSEVNLNANENNNNSVSNKNTKKKIGDRVFKVFRNNSHKHSDVVMEIINFINYMMTSQKMINLSKPQILTLYRIYVEEPINKQDVNAFFKMLKEADSKKALPQEVFQNIFEMMIESKKLEFSDISLDLFNCVWNFFLIINKNKGNLIINGASSGGNKPEGYSSVGPSGQQLYSFSYTNNQGSKNDEIRCVVDPKELIGFDLIWRLVLSSPNESQVAKEAINNIVKIFFNVKIEIKNESESHNKDDLTKNTNEKISQKGYSWGLLIEKCIETIKSITNKASSDSNSNSLNNTIINGNLNEPFDLNQKSNLEIAPASKDSAFKSPKASENQTKLINCLTILRLFIEETEKKGTAGCISHNSLLKSSILSLKIENSIFNSSNATNYNRSSGITGAAYSNPSGGNNTNQNQKDGKTFCLKVYANTTLWDLKKLIASRVNTLPEGIRINTNNSKDITENDHGKTLAELAMKDQDKLTVVLSSVFQNIPRAALTKNGKFTEKAEKTLSEIFSIFADEKNLMDQESAARFATIATDSSEPLLVDDSRVKHLFDTYDFDKDGFVSLEGFLKFFHDSIEVNRKVDTVWDNIKAFGYRNDLKKYNEPLDEYNSDLHVMPRFVISKNQEYFNAIFALQDEEEKIAKEASKFLSIICTNPVIYRDILLLKELGFEEKNNSNENENDSEDYFSDKNKNNTNAEIWLKYIDVNNRFKLLYVLQIIESFFEEFEFAAVDIDSEPIESVIFDESVKADLHPQHKIWWIEKFLSKGGLELIIQKLYLNIDFNEIVSSHYLWKKILNLSTKIIKNCFSFLFRASNLNKKEVVQFIRKESFGALDDLALKNKISSFEELNKNNTIENKDSNEGNNAIDNLNKKKENEDFKLQKQLSKKLSKDIENLKNDEELIKLIHKQYGDNIINRINFEQISHKLITFSYIISLKKETEVEERNFFNNSINLLSLIVISQENMKQFLHNLFTINEDIKDYIAKNEKVFNTNILNPSNANCNYSFLPPANILTFENFILTGILRNTSIIIRMNFQKCLSNLCESLQKMNEFSLNVFLLNLFKNLLTKVSAEEKTSSRYFFILFTNLLELNTHMSEEDEEKLCFDLLSVVFENPNTLPEDMLNGYLKILILILKKRKDLIEKIMQKFDIVNSVIDTFILKDVEKLKNLFSQESKNNEASNAEAKLEFMEIDNLKSFFEEKANCAYSAEAKNAIFNLLLILLKDNFENTRKFFNGKFAKITNYLSDLKKDKKMYNPSMEKRKKDSFIGIRNLHSICYMNSVLQQFFNVPSFRYALMQADDNKLLNFTEQNKEVDDNILHQLQRMFVYLEYSNRGEFNPSQFCYSFKDFEGNPTNVNIQNDSQEFLASLFDKLEFALKKTEFKYLLNSIFMGKTCSQLICKGGCGKIRNNFEDLYSLSLEVQGKKTLKDSLEKYISEERIEDFFCSNCQKKVNVIKRTSFAELPNILIVHLQRIIFNYETFMNEKINSRLEFPKKLNLKAYSTEVINNVEQEESNDSKDFNFSSRVNSNVDGETEENSEKKINDTNNNSNESNKNSEQEADESAKEFKDRVFHKSEDYYEYELVGVIVHLGIANAGHYYSYINIQRDGTENKMNFNPSDDTHVRKWMTFNDSSVLNFNVDQMETECFGGSANGKDDADDLIGWNKKNDWDNSKNAYMLVYERIKKTPITLVIPESHLQERKQEAEEKNTNQEKIDNLALITNKQSKNIKEIVNQKKLNDELISVNKSNYYKIQRQIYKITSSENSAKVPLDCDDTAISRRNVSSESIYNLLFHHEDKNEYFYYIPFYTFGKAEKRLLPAAHMREVLLDNLLFSNDQNIFCNEFSEFLDKAVIDLYEFYGKDENKNAKENENMYKQIFEILLGYALNILSKASSRDALGKLVNNLNKFLESFPEFSKLCLKNLVDNKELVTEILFSSEENANLAYKNLIVNAMLNYAKHYKKDILDYRNKKAENDNNSNLNNYSDYTDVNKGNCANNNLEISDFLVHQRPLVYKLLDNLIDLMPIEVSKIWNRMLAYLELFESLALSGEELLIDYLFEKELISRLIDLALGKESPLYRKGESRNEIGNKVAPPKFTPLLNTISNLVRRSYTDTFTNDSYLASGKKHFPNTLIQFEDNPDKIYTLSQGDIECLYQRSFYKKCIKDGYNNCALSKLLAHLMFDNFELSKKRVYMLMEAVNEGISLQDAKAACELLFNVLNLSDRYSVIRLEWVFGIPQLQMKLVDTPFPAVVNNSNKNKENKFASSERIYKFVSSILYGTTLDSLIERVIYKYQVRVDYITILVYFFSIVFKNKDTFVYFDALPHPKDEKLKLKDYIFQLANEELNRIYNVTNSESKFEKSIKSIMIFMESYESKKQEFTQALSEEGKEGAKKYKFQPAYSLGEIANEIIKHREDDVINKHNLFCFEIDYENEVKTFSENALLVEQDKEPVSGLDAQREDSKGNKNEYIDDEGETKGESNIKNNAEDIVIENANNDTETSKDKNEANKEEEKIAPLSDESNKNNSNNSNVAVNGDSDHPISKLRTKATKEVSRFDNNNITIDNNYNKNNLIDLKGTNDYSGESHNYSQNYTANKAIDDFNKNNEESFYRRNLDKLISSENAFVRSNPNLMKQLKDAKLNQNCIKRIILFNNSDNDYKVRFSFYTGDDFENFYLPQSDIIVIAKKNSVVNVQTFVKHDYLLPWNDFNFTIDCELYESGNNNDNRFKDSNVNFKKSKSQSDMKADANAEAPLALPAAGQAKPEVEYGPKPDGPINAAEDTLPIECMKCFHMNYFSSNTSTFICKGCNKDLFS